MESSPSALWIDLACRAGDRGRSLIDLGGLLDRPNRFWTDDWMMVCVFSNQKRSTNNSPTALPVQDSWCKDQQVPLSFSSQHSSIFFWYEFFFSTGTVWRKSYTLSHWAHAVALIWKIISEAALTINAILFSFFSLLLFLSHTPHFFIPLFRTLSLFLSFLVGRIYSEALRALSVRAIWLVCPFHKEREVRNPFSMYNTLHTHLNHTRCMLSNRPARLTLLHSVHSWGEVRLAAPLFSGLCFVSSTLLVENLTHCKQRFARSEPSPVGSEFLWAESGGRKPLYFMGGNSQGIQQDWKTGPVWDWFL